MPKAGAAAIGDARLRALHHYWRHKRGKRAMPARADIDPVEIPALLPIVGLVDVVDGGERFRYRLVGTEIVAASGCDSTGRHLDEVLSDGAYGEYVIGLFREMIERRRALYSETEWPGEGLVKHRVRRLLLPLSANGEAVDMVFSGQVAVGAGQGAKSAAGAGGGPFSEVTRLFLD